LSVDHTSSTYSEVKRHAFVLNLFAIVGLSLTAAMGILAFMRGDSPLGFSLMIASLVYLLSYLFQHITGKIIISSAVIIFSLYTLMIYLVYSGGVENTGPLWIFLVSPVALFIRGLKQGLVETSIFLSIVFLIMFVPGEFFSNESYIPEFRIRLMLSFLTVTFLSACYEYSREQSQRYTLELNKQYEKLAHYDQLTTLANRRGALKKLEIEQPSMIRQRDSLSVIVCDVDHFKKINDRYGHNAGDAVLVQLAQIFKQLIRGQDMIARWGGEEFLFILPHTSAEDAAIVAQKIHGALRNETILYQETKIPVTVSMGIEIMQPDQTIDEVINAADNYLYQAKREGRNQTFPRLDVPIPVVL